MPSKPRQAVFQPESLDDLKYWVSTDRKLALRLIALVEAILRDPFTGIGKPEPLRGILSGWWSRRITGEHRLVYRVVGTGASRELQIAQCRYHY